MKIRPWVALAGLVFLLRAAASATGGGAPGLREFVASRRLADLQRPDFSDVGEQVQTFYERRNYEPAWVRDGKATKPAVALIQALTLASAKGLDPEDYDAASWADRIANLYRPLQESRVARFDLALTVCAMRYILDLHLGRANPGVLHGSFDFGGESDLAGFVAHRLVNSNNVPDVLDALEPPFESYRRTEAALQKYLGLSAGSPIASFPSTKKPVDPGSPYPVAEQLAILLRKLGDLPVDASVPGGTYNGALVAAVKRFQTRHGLDPDGRIGNATVAALNVPLSRRVRQLELTLERWRWAPHSFPRPPVVVNIPEFKLRALNSAYQTELEMKVVVGKAYHHQTPVFSEDMKYVIFRPYWDVPASIERAEIVPKLEQDRSYLLKNRFEVVTADESVVSAGEIDDRLMARLSSGELRVRQVPGPENSLGLVKFLFPNGFDVYLHGTPATELFSRSRRDFSHGCIRVEKPVELAEWVLRGQPEWTRDRILEAMNGDRTIKVVLNRPIPVLIVYVTAVVLNSGEVRFFDDIYGEDVALENLLTKRRQSGSATSAEHGPSPRE